MKVSREIGKSALSCGVGAVVILFGTSVLSDQKTADVFFESPIGHPLLPDVIGKLGDREAWYQIDTGSSFTVVDERFRKDLPPSDKAVEVGDSGGKSIKLDLFPSPPLLIGAFPISIERVGVHDLSRFYLLTGLDHSVILGCDAIRGGVFLCDFDNDVLALRREFQVPDPDTWVTADVAFELSVPFVRQSIAGEEISFMVDTGSTGAVDLAPAHYEALVESGHIREEEDSKVLSAGGVNEVRTGAFTGGVLFGMPLEGVEVSTTRLRSKLGMDFLCHFNFAIDFPQSKAHFDLREGFDLLEVAKVLGVMFVYVDGTAIAYQVRPETTGASPAGKAGLEKGDRMVSFGSLNKGEIDLESLYQYLLERPEGEIPIELKRGESGDPFRRTLMLGKN